MVKSEYYVIVLVMMLIATVLSYKIYFNNTEIQPSNGQPPNGKPPTPPDDISPPVLQNAPNPIFTETYEGSGQTVHPDIIKFELGFKGALSSTYRYIMAITPYPYGNDDYENPCVIVSTSGESFIEDNIPNPITPAPVNPHHHSDTDIIYYNGMFYLYYRYDNSIKLKTSNNLVTWTPEKKVNLEGASPAFIYDYDSNKFKCWICQFNVGVEYYESADGEVFTGQTLTDIPNRIGDLYVWHIDVQKLKLSGKYIALITYSSGAGGKSPTYLFFGVSNDGLHWTVYDKPILSPSVSGWDNRFIYRSTFIVENGKIKVWYSAADTALRWHVGYCEADINVSHNEHTLNVIG